MALKHYTFWTWYQLLLRVARRAPSTLSLHILLLGVRASVIACNQTEHIFDPPHEGDNSLFSSTTQNTANDALRRVGKCQHTSAVQRLTTLPAKTILSLRPCQRDRLPSHRTVAAHRSVQRHSHIYNHETGTLVKTFEVSTVPVRYVRFIACKNWFIAWSDDFQLRVFNYNTHGKVASFEAHPDYIRCLAVHPTVSIVLTRSGDMTIKAWDWDKQWKNIQVRVHSVSSVWR